MTLVLAILLPLIAGTLLCASLGLRSRSLAAAIALAVTLGSVALLGNGAGTVVAGETLNWRLDWIPEIGLNISLRLDGLSLMFALLITVMGVLIVIYAHFYLAPEDSAARFYSLMMLFMAAMLGVVLSNNVLMLFVFWELTSLSSFLLVGYWGHRHEARAGARQALAITGGGGLAMLAGFVMLGQIAGTYELSEMYAQAASIQAHAWFVPSLVLVLIGCFTKSAQFPFHFWLPDAMAAPTPVSAYLHSATMVKAGVFLMMRMWPIFVGSGWFEGIVATIGLITVCFAAFIALFKHDLKGLLAYSTVSHLGLLTFLVGLGSPLAAVAAVFHLLNHACFKAPLFMVAGIVDHETHTRDMRRLGGLWRAMPWTATLAMVATASMAGIPLTGGFLSKEMYFAEAIEGSVWGTMSGLLPVLATLAAAFSVAYSLRFVHDTFFNGPQRSLPNDHPHEPPAGMRWPAGLLVVLCIAVGVAPMLVFGPIVQFAATAMTQEPLPDFEIALWHGFNLALLMSLLALAGGALLYRWLSAEGRLHRIDPEQWFTRTRGRALFEGAIGALIDGSGRLTRRTENGSLQQYLAWLIVAAIIAGLAASLDGTPAAGTRSLTPAGPVALAVWAILVLTCVLILRHYRNHFHAVLLVGVVGLVTALAFFSMSAPDLALTQLSVEVVSTVLLLMGLAFLPQHSPRESSVTRRSRDAVLAGLGGAGVGLFAWWVITRPQDSIAWYFLREAVPLGGGTNVVNVILVDFRGYDTLGEITVLGIAALGVHALMTGMRAARPGYGPEGVPWSFAQPSLLLRVATSVALPVALIFSVYIFMRGHNLPGGGFIAGLITAVALVMQFMALGQQQAESALRARGGERFVRWIAAGLAIAGLTGVGAFFFGRPFLTSAHGVPDVWLLGELPLATAALFDLGVYLTVVGSTMLTVSALGQASSPRSPDHRTTQS